MCKSKLYFHVIFRKKEAGVSINCDLQRGGEQVEGLGRGRCAMEGRGMEMKNSRTEQMCVCE